MCSTILYFPREERYDALAASPSIAFRIGRLLASRGSFSASLVTPHAFNSYLTTLHHHVIACFLLKTQQVYPAVSPYVQDNTK